MFYRIVHDIPGRLRLRCPGITFSENEARGIAHALAQVKGVRSACAHPANGSILVEFEPEARNRVLDAVRKLDVLHLPTWEGQEHDLELRDNQFKLRLTRMAFVRLIRRTLIPMPVRRVLAIARAVPFILRGLADLARRKFTVSVLDATAVAVALIRGSFSEASSVMFMLRLSTLLEEHVQSRVRLALQEGLITRAETVWRVVRGRDVEVRLADVRKGHLLHLQRGCVLPVDGVVEDGEGEVDESSLTGEAKPVHKAEGSLVYAGTALEEGSLYVRVSAPPGDTRIDDIVRLVESSADLKAQAQSRAEHLADALVPASLVAFFGTLAVTRNLARASSVLMVDYSCAIKLTTPVAVMSAMREAADHGIVVKGGKYLEALADADVVVFDKTGTLTESTPQVERILPFADMGERQLLKYAACIEEHFPHSVARAIVREAKRRRVYHKREVHTSVEYVVAHGIRAQVDGNEMCIGSQHFIFEDEGVRRPELLDEMMDKLAPRSSVVYVASEGRLLGAICVSDPIRPEASGVLRRLRELGIERSIMLTGDAEASAHATAELLGIDEYRSQMLPEDKAAFLDELRAQGHTVIMVGDGINDSPALARASVSVALSDASDIARAVADVSVRDSSLESLVVVRELSQRLMRRVHTNYASIVGFNSALIALGIAGVLSTTTAAYLHNASTVAFTARNTRPLLTKPGERLLLPAAASA